MAKRLLAQKRVLVVEDDKSYAKELMHSLTRHGAEVRCAYTQEEAIRLFEQQKPPFNLALVDIRFDGVSEGFELAHNLRIMKRKMFPKRRFITVGMSHYRDEYSSKHLEKYFSKVFRKIDIDLDPDWLPRELASLLSSRTLYSVKSSRDKHANLLQKLVDSWWITAILAGVIAAISTLVLILLPSNWLILKIAYIVGLFVAIIVWLRDPRKRYYRGFLIALSLLASANAVPALGLEVTGSDSIIKYFSKGPGASFNLALGAIIIVLLVLDRYERLK